MPDTSQKVRPFLLRFYMQKCGHFALRDFHRIIEIGRGGRDISICKKMQFTLLFCKQKTMHFALHFYIQKFWHFALHFIYKKQCTLCYVFMSKIYPATARTPWDIGSAGRMTKSRADWQKGEQERRQKNTPPVCREGVGESTVVQGKGLEGGGQIEGTGNSKSVD